MTTIDVMLAKTGRHLLSQIDRDPYSPTRGCFDRRYWAWKLVDFPEATYQRNALLLAWLARRESVPARRAVFLDALEAAFDFTATIQHRDGSFDQAFPHEHSFGATAFILESLTSAASLANFELAPSHLGMLRQAGRFLRAHRETHGAITNHLAGGALGLLEVSLLTADREGEDAADRVLASILAMQSREGWFPEYGGADPGYQTLCVHYLARYHELKPGKALADALERSVAFLSWFVHPDGTFGGEYGSRRTSVYYPGGIALLARTSRAAAALHGAMIRSIENGTTTTLEDVDFANVAPLSASYALAQSVTEPADEVLPLPWQRPDAAADFHEAGLSVHARGAFYVVFGTSNGGVVKVFDRERGDLLLDDTGYHAIANGRAVSSQVFDPKRRAEVAGNTLACTVDFAPLKTIVTTPLRFSALRLLNLTVMRSIAIGNLVKAVLVRLLISSGGSAPLRLRREVIVGADRVTVNDVVSRVGSADITALECGRPFVSVHMASARYFTGAYRFVAARSDGLKELRASGKASIVRSIGVAAP